MNNSDEVQSSYSNDEQQSTDEQSDQEGKASDDDNITSEDDKDNDMGCSDTVDSEVSINEQSEDEDREEKKEKFIEVKVRTPHLKKNLKNDVAEGRTIFIRYVHMYMHTL